MYCPDVVCLVQTHNTNSGLNFVFVYPFAECRSNLELFLNKSAALPNLPSPVCLYQPGDLELFKLKTDFSCKTGGLRTVLSA